MNTNNFVYFNSVKLVALVSTAAALSLADTHARAHPWRVHHILMAHAIDARTFTRVGPAGTHVCFLHV